MPELDKLSNKVAIVTGAGQTPGQTIGNGRATALLFAEHGASVLVTDRNIDSAEQTVAQIEAAGGTALAFAMDVSQEADCEMMVARCIEAFGQIDILHNNVGIGAGDNKVTALELDAWRHIMDINLTSMFLTCKHVLPAMQARQSGVILNISSLAAVAATPMVAYKTSKAAIIALTENLAISNAKYGIRANCILPGLINTPMAIEGYAKLLGKPNNEIIAHRDKQVPLNGKMGTAWDIAKAALFLASDDAAFITGITLPVDGGQRLRVG